MPQPNSESKVDAVLSNVSVAYMQQEQNFIADKVFPVVPVDIQTGKYYSYTKNDWLRDEAKRRGDTDESEGGGYNLGNASYSCDVFAWHQDVGNKTAANFSNTPSVDLYESAAQFVTHRLMLRREKQWAADYFANSVWGTSTTPSNLWSDFTLSTPIEDVDTAKTTILTNTGFLPNTMVVSYPVFIKLKEHPDVVDKIKYTQTGVVTEQLLAQVFGVDKFLVAKATNATNVEGETAVYANVAGKHALVCYVNPTPGLLQPSAGYIFSWRGVSTGLGFDIAIKRIEMETRDAVRIEGELAFDDKLVSTDLGYFFNSVVS